MILLARERGIKVFVLDLPTSPDSNHYGEKKMFGEGYRDLIVRLERELKRVTSEESVPFIESGPLDKNDFYDHCHNTSSGHQKIAQKLYIKLSKKLK